MTSVRTQPPLQVTLAYMAAGLFFLAGIVSGIAALASHGRLPVAFGTMWFAVGALWTVIARRFAKKAVS